jgi:hypothetical protein
VTESYKGGCSCGAVRFELVGRPLWVLACHCDACKKRTGSAYGVAVMVEKQQVAAFTGERRIYTRLGDSGNKVRYEFCPSCATTLCWHVDIVPQRQAFAGGAFDDMRALNLIAEMYADDALPWSRLNCTLSRRQAPDDDFRHAMVATMRRSE